MDIEKLRAILTELGVEPEKIEAAVAAMSEDASTEQVSVEGKSEEPTTSEKEPVEEGEPTSEGGEPVEKEGEETVEVPQEETPADPASVPPVEEVPPEPQPELPPEVTEEGVPAPTEPELPPVVSLEEFNDVKNQLEETKKALEGANAKIDSLVQSLQDAGVISGNTTTSVGHDQPSVPGVPQTDVMDEVLAEINKKGY